MAKGVYSLRLFGVLLCLFAYSTCESTFVTVQPKKQEKTWCVLSDKAPGGDSLESLIDFLCRKHDCAEIKPGGTCFVPNTLRAHASYALNLFYNMVGDCRSLYGNITNVDPSHGACHQDGRLSSFEFSSRVKGNN